MSETSSATKKSDNKQTPNLNRNTKLKVVVILSAIAFLIVSAGAYWFLLRDNEGEDPNAGLTEEEIEFNQAIEEYNLGPTQEEREEKTPVFEQAVEAAIGADDEAEKRYELAHQYISVGEYKKAETENKTALQLAKEQGDEELIKVLEEQAESISNYLNLLERHGL